MKISVSLIVIKADYNEAMARIDSLMAANSGEGSAAGTVEAAEFKVLSILAEKYEEAVFPMES